MRYLNSLFHQILVKSGRSGSRVPACSRDLKNERSYCIHVPLGGGAPVHRYGALYCILRSFYFNPLQRLQVLVGIDRCDPSMLPSRTQPDLIEKR